MNISIKKLKAGDVHEFMDMLRLFADVFELTDYQMPGEDYLTKLLSKDGFIVYAAIHNDAVVGGLTAHTLPSYNYQSSEVYIYDLAIKTSCQRNGIGKQLLIALTAYCRENNYKEFFVQADEPDTHALEFYRATGGMPGKVVHFSYKISD